MQLRHSKDWRYMLEMIDAEMTDEEQKRQHIPKVFLDAFKGEEE